MNNKVIQYHNSQPINLGLLKWEITMLTKTIVAYFLFGTTLFSRSYSIKTTTFIRKQQQKQERRWLFSNRVWPFQSLPMHWDVNVNRQTVIVKSTSWSVKRYRKEKHKTCSTFAYETNSIVFIKKISFRFALTQFTVEIEGNYLYWN